MRKLTITIFLSILLLLGFSTYSPATPLIVNLIGDKDQNEWYDNIQARDDGVGVNFINKSTDPDGFDTRQVGTTVNWSHDISDQINDIMISSMRLDIAVLGLIDNNWEDIDNELYINGTEIQKAFDDSYDGWRLYSFDVTDMLIDGCLNIELVSHEDEGWAGPDYSELFVYGEKIDSSAAPVPEPGTMLLLGSGLLSLAGFRRKFKK